MTYRARSEGRKGQQQRKRVRKWRKFYRMTASLITNQPEPRWLMLMLGKPHAKAVTISDI